MAVLDEGKTRLIGKGPRTRRKQRSSNPEPSGLYSRPFYNDGRLLFTVSVNRAVVTSVHPSAVTTWQVVPASPSCPDNLVDKRRPPSFGEALRIAGIASACKRASKLAICDRPARLSGGRRLRRKMPAAQQLVKRTRWKETVGDPCTPRKRKLLAIADITEHDRITAAMSDRKVERRATRWRCVTKSSACLLEQRQLGTPIGHVHESLLNITPSSDCLQSCGTVRSKPAGNNGVRSLKKA
mmetsp:Transcript_81292/g.161363  ORF Transcript_81292/g.161363 Transcript_81292/m.161363 type:complete len:240 (-) Transcript_81292:117-836(-)